MSRLNKFFSSFLKNPEGKRTSNGAGKKALFFVLLFFVVAGIIIPQIGAAQIQPNTKISDILGRTLSNALGIIANLIAGPFINAIVFSVAFIPLAITALLADFAGLLLKVFVSITTSNLSYTQSTAVLIGWPRVRDLANMIIILGILIVAIATILRFKEYEAKKLLPKLLIAALLINFSLLICGIFIDGSNILIKNFLNTTSLSDVFQNLSSTALLTLTGNVLWSSPFRLLPKIIGMIFFNIVATVIFLLYGFLFAFRIMALWILIILSPLAFVCYVFPATKSIWQMWWKNFFQWCIIGAPAAFFLWLGTAMNVGMNNLNNGLNLENDPTVSQLRTALSGIFTEMVGFAVPALFLIVGFIFSLQTSAMGAGAITGGAKWLMGKAKSAGKIAGMAALKGAANVTGATGAATRAKDWATQHLENMGAMRPGATAAAQRTRLNESKRAARVDAMTDEEKLEELRNPKRGQESRLERAKIMEKLAQERKLGMLNAANGINAARRQELIDESMQSGVRAKTLITGMESADVANIINNNQYDAETRAEGFKTLRKRGDLDLIRDAANPANTPVLRRAAVTNAMAHGEAIEEVEKSDHHYGAQNEARRQRIRQANQTITHDPLTGAKLATPRAITEDDIDELAMQQVLDERLTSMDHDQLRNIDERHLSGKKGAQRVDRLTPDKLNAFQLAPQPVRAAVKSHFNDGSTGPQGQLHKDFETARSEYLAALAAGDQAAASNRHTEARRLRTLFMAQNNFSGT